MTPKFIQIHFLAAWPGALLNRDDAGLSKRLPFGAATRTRISSQCLKRHWRKADDPRALYKLAEEKGIEGVRSKITIEREVIKPLEGRFSKEAREAVQGVFLTHFYGKNAKSSDSRQALLFGRPEIAWMRENAERILSENPEPKAAEAATVAWIKEGRANLAQLRDQTALSASLEAALFGRMVTSDTRANTDAAIHVAHAFTVHEEQPELDYFTVVDDLRDREQGDDAGAAGVFDTELTSGLYYGYVVVDVPLLVSNLTGCKRADWAGDQDRELAARVVENLVHLVAEVSPGAKKGSTAPYSRAELVLVEAGDRQPRTLANAFRDPVSLSDRESNRGLGFRTAEAMTDHLAAMDKVYETGEARRHAALPDLRLAGVENGSLRELAAWAGAIVRTAAVEGDAPDLTQGVAA